MGCDIHLHVEVKVNNKWEHYSHPQIRRDYRLFGIMAGVRDSSVIPISEPKGLPEDLSLITRIDRDYDGEYMHSESWLDKKEIKKLFLYMQTNPGEDEWAGQWEHNELGYANGDSYWIIGDSDCGHPKEYEDVRFVFWFDS